MPAFNLADVGLHGVVNLNGTATVLLYIPNTPIVFLFDEHHLTPACIQQNKDNGDAIRAQAAIGLVGVESHKAKFPAGPGTVLNQQPEFADYFGNQGLTVYGVEYEELSTDLEDDINNSLWPAIDAHPFNYLRSHYYLSVLFRTRRYEGLAGNLFLNAGTKHIDHIAAMIQRGEIAEIAGEPSTYVRVRSTAHPSPGP